MRISIWWCLLPALTLPAVSASAQADKIAHGKYLVERVAMCVDCHTPHTDKGELDKTKWLAGSELGFVPTHPMPWANMAPPLAGLPGWTETQMVKYMMTGVNNKGEFSRPPMPPYRLSQQDAEAVAAYLKSLKAK